MLENLWKVNKSVFTRFCINFQSLFLIHFLRSFQQLECLFFGFDYVNFFKCLPLDDENLKTLKIMIRREGKWPKWVFKIFWNPYLRKRNALLLKTTRLITRFGKKSFPNVNEFFQILFSAIHPFNKN